MSLNKLLFNIGLNRYQILIFKELLKNESKTAKDLNQITKVPMGKIYSEIDALNKLNLIQKDGSRPTKFFIDSPRNKIIELLESEKHKFETLEKDALNELGKFSKDSEVFHLNSEIRQSQILSFRWAKDEICQCLGIIHNASENRDLKSVYEKEIFSAVQRGVEFKALYLKGQVPPKSLLDLSKESPDLFKIRYSNLPIPRFDIVDSKQILFKIQDPGDTSKTIGTIIINNLPFAKKLRQKFLNLWNSSD